MKTTQTRTWDNLLLERVIEYGYAARGNRGSFSGKKVHTLVCEYVIGRVDDGIETKPGTIDHRWKMRQRVDPNARVLFCCYPLCGCTQGQNAGSPSAGLTEESVTCDKCRAAIARPTGNS